MLSKGTDGYNLEMFNKERNNLRQALQRETGDFIYSIASKKAKYRPNIIKRYNGAYQKIATFS